MRVAKRLKFGLLGILFILIIIFGRFLFLKSNYSTAGNPSSSPIYSFSHQKYLLKTHYPNLYSSLIMNSEKDAPVIPNLLGIDSLKASDGSPGVSTQMDPQGVTRSENYLLVSAYSRDHAYNSVIIVIHATTGDYLKTVILPSTAHVGGITYDDKSQNIWISTASGEGAGEVSSITYETFNSYDFSKSKTAISFDQSIDLGNITQSSFLTYYDGSLFIGFFEKTGDGVLTRYDINSDGTMDVDYSSQLTLAYGESLAKPENIYPIDNKIQGMTIYDNVIIISKSYGSANSELQLFKFTDLSNINLDRKADATIAAPPYMEQISTYNDSAYLVFESGAPHYRTNSGIVKVDRVLELDLKNLVSTIQ